MKNKPTGNQTPPVVFDTHSGSTCKLSDVDDAQAMYGANRQRIVQKPAALLLVAAAYLIGGGGMLAWLAFLLIGPLAGFDFEHGMAGRLLMDAFLCLLFFVQHSVMVRRGFRLWLTRIVHADFHGVVYASASGCCLLILAGLWQPVEPAIWTPAGPIRWVLIGLFLAAGAGAWWGTRSLETFDALGVKPALRVFNPDMSAPANPFIIRGPYRWVRHPLYLFSLIIIWAGPIFTVDRLVHNGLWTIWIVIGAGLEERDLVDCFGDEYRSYQKTVPMLLPKSLRPLVDDFSKKR